MCGRFKRMEERIRLLLAGRSRIRFIHRMSFNHTWVVVMVAVAVAVVVVVGQAEVNRGESSSSGGNLARLPNLPYLPSC